MKQNDYQKILADLKRFDVEVCHRQVKSVAGAALRFVEEQLQQPYASLVLYDPDKKSMRMLTRSEGDTVSSEPFPAGDPPDMIAMAMEKGEVVYCRDLYREKGSAGMRSRVGFPEKFAPSPCCHCGRRGRMGTFNVGSRRVDWISADQQVFLEGAATRLAAALQSALVLEELHSSCERLQKECDLQKSALKKSHDALELECQAHGGDPETTGTAASREHPIERGSGWRARLRWDHRRKPLAQGSHLPYRAGGPTNANVLILGESGTGKELIAREIHRENTRKDRSLVKVNCATIPKELYESEFFGHVKGAFTGAVSDRMGRFEAADGGTLFLDEVGEIPPSLQGKLLRVLQEGEFERVGEGRTRKVDVRIIAATNKNLMEEIKSGRFREDLYYRLNVFPVEVTPLRDRKEDIPLLVTHFIEVLSRRLNRPVPRLTEANLMDMKAHDWPGNARNCRISSNAR